MYAFIYHSLSHSLIHPPIQIAEHSCTLTELSLLRTQTRNSLCPFLHTINPFKPPLRIHTICCVPNSTFIFKCLLLLRHKLTILRYLLLTNRLSVRTLFSNRKMKQALLIIITYMADHFQLSG